MQLAMAGFIGAAILLILAAQFRPALWRAIERLPENARITSVGLQWPDRLPATLVETDTMAILALGDQRSSGSPLSDFEIALRDHDLQIKSFLGYRTFPYLAGYTMDLSRSAVEPLYGAWEAPIFLAIVFGSMAGLMLTWHLLGTMYGLVVKLLAWAYAKPLTFLRAYKVGVGALAPGAILMFAGLFAYGLGQLDLPRLAILWAFHIILGWLYLALAIPKISTADIQNPFNQPAPEPMPKPGKSPFASSSAESIEVEEEPSKNPFEAKKKPSAIDG